MRNICRKHTSTSKDKAKIDPLWEATVNILENQAAFLNILKKIINSNREDLQNRYLNDWHKELKQEFERKLRYFKKNNINSIAADLTIQLKKINILINIFEPLSEKEDLPKKLKTIFYLLWINFNTIQSELKGIANEHKAELLETRKKLTAERKAKSGTQEEIKDIKNRLLEILDDQSKKFDSIYFSATLYELNTKLLNNVIQPNRNILNQLFR